MLELLLPAGDLKKAYCAFKYGADAIYCGISMFSLRTKMNFFTENDIKEITEYAHSINKKVYVTVNSFPHQHLMPILEQHLHFLSQIKPDALIIADTGVLTLANEICPHIKKHLSVQTSTVNIPAMRFWLKNGVNRIILAREISLAEVIKIHTEIPDLELEYFVHGAVCMSYSGRCLLSNFMAARDANKGVCAHSCRWNYRIYDENGYQIMLESTNNIPDKKEIYIHDLEKKQYWEEELRPNDFIPVEEDFHGSHIMSSRDMCMIEYLAEIKEAGIVSLKVEGRNKTVYYLATIARAYRQALNDLFNHKSFDLSLWDEIQATANRGFFAGFLKGKPNIEGQQYGANVSTSKYEFIGEVLKWENGKIKFTVKNRLNEGEEIEFIYPNIKDDIKIIATELCQDKNGELLPVISLHGGDTDGWIKCLLEIDSGVLMRKKFL